MRFIVPITAAIVDRLRTETNETMMDCKKILTIFDGDYDAAIKYMRETPLHARRGFILDGRRCPCCGK